MHLEEPFADIPNGLASSAMAETIEIDLRDVTGEGDLPPLPRLHGFVSMRAAIIQNNNRLIDVANGALCG